MIYVCSSNAKDARSLRNSNVTFFDVCVSDAAGKFETEPLSPGRYMLLVAGYKPRDPNHVKPSDINSPRYFAAREIRVEQPKPPLPIEMALAVEDNKVPNPIHSTK